MKDARTQLQEWLEQLDGPEVTKREIFQLFKDIKKAPAPATKEVIVKDETEANKLRERVRQLEQENQQLKFRVGDAQNQTQAVQKHWDDYFTIDLSKINEDFLNIISNMSFDKCLDLLGNSYKRGIGGFRTTVPFLAEWYKTLSPLHHLVLCDISHSEQQAWIALTSNTEAIAAGRPTKTAPLKFVGNPPTIKMELLQRNLSPTDMNQSKLQTGVFSHYLKTGQMKRSLDGIAPKLQ